MQKLIAKIEDLNHRGYGVSSIENRTIWILNALPGEEVVARVFKTKKGIKYAIAEKILKKSKLRIEPKEDHYLSCSPWQILSQTDELKIKKKIIIEAFKQHADTKLPTFSIVESNREYGYRNKMEFSFYGDENDYLHLAFYKREGNRSKYTFDSCVLAPDIINQSARTITNFLNDKNIKAFQLKGLMLRYSFHTKKSIACLYIKDENVRFNREEIDQLLNEELKGIVVNYSNKNSPACIESKRLLSVGKDLIEEKVNKFTFSFPFDGFFQVNPHIFGLAVNDIAKFIQSLKNHEELIVADVYAGIGTIGIMIAPLIKEVLGVEYYKHSFRYSQNNAKRNKIKNFSFVQGKAENEGLGVITFSDIIILDPPRSGLHPKLIKQINSDKPKYIIYLSCNSQTQARNFNEFKDHYDIKFFRAYNFYPHTPHVESLIIMKSK